MQIVHLLPCKTPKRRAFMENAGGISVDKFVSLKRPFKISLLAENGFALQPLYGFRGRNQPWAHTYFYL